MKYVINIDLENPISEGVYADLDTGATWILSEQMAQKLIPLITCKDCKHFGGGTFCREVDAVWDENSYCSYAERKEQDDG